MMPLFVKKCTSKILLFLLLFFDFLIMLVIRDVHVILFCKHLHFFVNDYKSIAANIRPQMVFSEF